MAVYGGDGVDEERLDAIVAEIGERIAIIEELSKAFGSTKQFAADAQVATYKACLRLLSGTNSDDETRTEAAKVRR